MNELDRTKELNQKLDRIYGKLECFIDAISDHNWEYRARRNSMEAMLNNIRKYELEKEAIHLEMINDLQKRFIRLKYSES